MAHKSMFGKIEYKWTQSDTLKSDEKSRLHVQYHPEIIVNHLVEDEDTQENFLVRYKQGDKIRAIRKVDESE